MIASRFRVLVAAALLAPCALSGDDDNLLHNGDFETGGKSAVADWSPVYPVQMAKPPPRYFVDATRAHGGTRAASIAVEYKGGYSSLTQNVHPPKDAKAVHFEAWARIDGESKGGAASIMIYFTVPSHADGGVAAMSRRLVDEQEWTLLTLDAAVPDGATEMTVRCGVVGPCAASFDDALLTLSNREATACKLAVAHGDYEATSHGSDDAPWISVSVPFPIGGQTPLAVRVTSDPPGRVRKLGIDADRENRPLQVFLAPQDGGTKVTLKVETLALLRDRPFGDASGVSLTSLAKPPKDVQIHTKRAQGVDVDAPDVKKIAAALDRKDFGALMASVAKVLDERLEYSGGEPQGAKRCLESGKAVCTGYANTAAAILIAARVPTRILACTGLNARLQEHYIVEAWGGELGWCRMESTMARFPWPDSENLVLRIVYPDASRSIVDVPLYTAASGNMTCAFHMGEDSCWQGGEVLATTQLDTNDAAAIEAAARGRFEQVAKKPEQGSAILLLDAKVAAGLGESGKAVYERARTWLDAR